MSNIDLPLLRQVQHDIEEYLSTETSSEDINDHQFFILMHYIYVGGMAGFLGTVIDLLAHIDRNYNDYLKACIFAVKRRFTAYRAYYRLPRGIQPTTVINILNDMENTLYNRYNWKKLAEELEKEEFNND